MEALRLCIAVACPLHASSALRRHFPSAFTCSPLFAGEAPLLLQFVAAVLEVVSSTDVRCSTQCLPR